MKITELAQGTRSVEELVREHIAWERKTTMQESLTLGDIVVFERTPAQEHDRQLNLLATQLETTDIEEAIACMRRSCALKRAMGNYLPDRRSLRLSRFLQKAGRMREAMREYLIAMDDVDKYADTDMPQSSHTERSAAVASGRSRIYDEMRIAWTRAGDPGMASAAEQLSNWHAEMHQRLNDVAEQERKGRSQHCAAIGLLHPPGRWRDNWRGVL